MSKVYKDKFIQLFCMAVCLHLILMIFIKKSDGRLVGLPPKLVNLAPNGNSGNSHIQLSRRDAHTDNQSITKPEHNNSRV